MSDEKIKELIDYQYAMAEIEYDHIMEQEAKKRQASDPRESG